MGHSENRGRRGLTLPLQPRAKLIGLSILIAGLRRQLQRPPDPRGLRPRLPNRVLLETPAAAGPSTPRR